MIDIHGLMAPLGPFGPSPHMGVAVSGGPDSMALVKALKEWVGARAGQLTCLHFDHRLRPSSSEEALRVQAWMHQWGVPCHIIPWEHAPLESALMEKARAARYARLCEACIGLGIGFLATGHHRSDDLETFFMRKEKKSGRLGLAGISRRILGPGNLAIIRPFLGEKKERLIAYLEGHPYIQDPSNYNPSFKRSQLRACQIFTEDDEGQLDAYKLERRRAEERCERYIRSHASFHQAGYAYFKSTFREAARTHKFEASLALRHLIWVVGGSAYAPSPEKCGSILDAWISSPSFRRATLGKCILVLAKSGLWIVKEPKRAEEKKISSLSPFLWDNLFFVDSIHENTLNSGLTLKYLGHKAFARVKAAYEKDLPSWIGASIPALWEKEGVVYPLFTSCYFSEVAKGQAPLRLRADPVRPLLPQPFL